MVEKITAEAKKIRKANPQLTWQQALKKAGAKLRGTSVKKTTSVRKPVKKGISIKSTGIKKVGKIPLKRTGIKSIGSEQKFISVAKSKGFRLYGADLDDVLKFMLQNDKAIFGKSIKTMSWFNFLDEYEFVIDVLSDNKIDTEPLEDEITAPRYWNKIKKSKIGASVKPKLISIPKSKIDIMSETQVLKNLQKAEYSKVFTDATYKNLDLRLMKLNKSKSKINGDLLIMHSGSKTRSKKGFGKLPGPSDPDAVREIELFIENDGDLYRQQTYPILKNLTKKYVKGTFKVEPAAKLFRYLIDNGMKKYHKEFGSRSSKWYELLSTSDRQYLAMQMAKDTLLELNAGNRWEL